MTETWDIFIWWWSFLCNSYPTQSFLISLLHEN